MPTNMRGFIESSNIDKAQLAEGGRYSNGHKVLRIPVSSFYDRLNMKTMVYDKKEDPMQQHPLSDEALIKEMDGKLKTAMEAAGAPEWQFRRMGFEKE